MQSTLPRRRTVTVAALVSCAATVIALAGCSSSSPESSNSASCAKTYKIGYSNPTSEAAVVKALTVKLKAEAAAHGCIDLLLDNTTGGNLEHQRATLESWVAQGVSAIVVTPVDVTALTNLRKEAQAKGLKWISYGVLEKGANGLAGFDNEQSGRIVGQAATDWIAKHHLDGKVTAAVTTFTPLAAVSGRWKQPINILNKAGVKIVSSQDCADPTCGQNIAEALIQSDPKFRVFIGFNDDAALGAAQAFKDAGISPKDTFIAGQDGSPPALEAVQSGEIDVSAAIVLKKLADAVLEVSINAINGHGKTTAEAPVIAGTLADPSELKTLLAQYK